jgi:hypothetical protein
LVELEERIKKFIDMGVNGYKEWKIQPAALQGKKVNS